MLRFPWTLTLALAAPAAVAAEPVDPLKSAACEQALQRLQLQEAQAASAPQARPRTDGSLRPPDARVEGLRRSAARICLGSRADVPPPPPPERRVQAPISVVPVAPVGSARPLPQLPVPATPATPAALPRVEAPTVITSCDPTGCWASDGSRLNRMGQNLLGPRGLCSVQGNLLQCP